MSYFVRVFFLAICASFLNGSFSTANANSGNNVTANISAGKVSAQKKKKKTKKARVSSLTQLPYIGNLLKKAKRGKKSPATYALALSGPGTRDVSGTPPTLLEIAESPIKELFWRSGVIDEILSGDPSQASCNEFFAGNQSGTSGGQGACHMTQGVGYSFQPILTSGTSLCYMKNAPTAENMAAGGLSLISGTLPDDDITQLFNAPSGSEDRLVQVQATNFPDFGEGGPSDENIFIKIFSQDNNRDNGNQYHVQLWFCSANQSDTPRGYNEITVKTNGVFRSVDAGTDFGSFESVVQAALSRSGNRLTFDTSRSRSADVVFISEEGFAFKANIDITANNSIKLKTYDAMEGNSRKAYSISRFSGTGIDNLRFLEGAYKDEIFQDNELLHSFDGATEFRNTYYAAAGNTELSNQLRSVDFDSNPFYAEEPTLTVDTSAFSCEETPDIVIGMDMSNSALQEVALLCEQNQLNGMDFCRQDEEVAMAEQTFFAVCSFGDGPGEGE